MKIYTLYDENWPHFIVRNIYFCHSTTLLKQKAILAALILRWNERKWYITNKCPNNVHFSKAICNDMRLSIFPVRILRFIITLVKCVHNMFKLFVFFFFISNFFVFLYFTSMKNNKIHKNWIWIVGV